MVDPYTQVVVSDMVDDVELALSFISEQLEELGGDPDNVTLMV